MDLKDIQNLIKFVVKSGASEVKLETPDYKISVKTGSESDQKIAQYMPLTAAAPIAVPQTPAVTTDQQSATTSSETQDSSKYITVKSPMIGTFYLKPSPDKPNFTDVGQRIAEGDVLCIIEAMKLFNEIESEVSGTIVKILVDDASPVEFDQPLFLVDPS
jgi:acetyl-CoA carboxylase biotin carboxyl carrier protein